MCGQKSSIARKFPSTLKMAIIFPSTGKARPSPLGIASTLETSIKFGIDCKTLRWKTGVKPPRKSSLSVKICGFEVQEQPRRGNLYSGCKGCPGEKGVPAETGARVGVFSLTRNTRVDTVEL